MKSPLLLFCLALPSFAGGTTEDPDLHTEWENEDMIQIKFEEKEFNKHDKIRPDARPNADVKIPGSSFLKALGIPKYSVFQANVDPRYAGKSNYNEALDLATLPSLGIVALTGILDEFAHREGIIDIVTPKPERAKYFSRSSLLTLVEIREALLERQLTSTETTITDAERAVLQSDLDTAKRLLKEPTSASDPCPDLSEESPEHWEEIFQFVKKFHSTRRAPPEGSPEGTLGEYPTVNFSTVWKYHCEEVPMTYAPFNDLAVNHRRRLGKLCDVIAKENKKEFKLSGPGYLQKAFEHPSNQNFKTPVKVAEVENLEHFDTLFQDKILAKYTAINWELIQEARAHVFQGFLSKFLNSKGGFKKWLSQTNYFPLYDGEMKIREKYKNRRDADPESREPAPQTLFDDPDFELIGTEVLLPIIRVQEFRTKLRELVDAAGHDLLSEIQSARQRILEMPSTTSAEIAARNEAARIFTEESKRKCDEFRLTRIDALIDQAIQALENPSEIQKERVSLRYSITHSMNLPQNLPPLEGARVQAFHPSFSQEQGMAAQFQSNLELIPMSAYKDPEQSETTARILIGKTLTQYGLDSYGLSPVLSRDHWFLRSVIESRSKSALSKKLLSFAQREVVYDLFLKNAVSVILPTPWTCPDIALFPAPHVDVTNRLFSARNLANALFHEFRYDGSGGISPSYVIEQKDEWIEIHAAPLPFIEGTDFTSTLNDETLMVKSVRGFRDELSRMEILPRIIHGESVSP